jgi:hypothetical protein
MANHDIQKQNTQMARMMSPKKMAAPAVIAQAAPKRKRSSPKKAKRSSPKKAKRSTRKVIKTSRKFKSMLL